MEREKQARKTNEELDAANFYSLEVIEHIGNPKPTRVEVQREILF